MAEEENTKGQMGRAETYTLSAVTVLLSWLLSVYGKEAIRILHRGGVQARIDSLTHDIKEVETMHVHLPFLISHIGYTMFRVLFLVGLLILATPHHSFTASFIFGVMTSQITRVLKSINRVNSYDTFISESKIKLEKLKSRVRAAG